MPFIFSIAIDLICLVVFGYSLSHGASSGLISPTLQPVWLIILLCMHLVFFWGVYSRLLRISSIKTVRERLQKHRVLYGVLCTAAWAIAILQTIFHITIIFLNSVFTTQYASTLTTILTVTLMTCCAIAVALLASTPRHGDRLKPLRSIPLLYGFASILFPLPTLVLFFTRTHDAPASSANLIDSKTVETVLHIAFNYIVLNILHIELAVATSSGPHSFASYISRAAIIMALLYIPYYAVLQCGTKKRLHALQVVWPAIYFVVELGVVYFAGI